MSRKESFLSSIIGEPAEEKHVSTPHLDDYQPAAQVQGGNVRDADRFERQQVSRDSASPSGGTNTVYTGNIEGFKGWDGLRAVPIRELILLVLFVYMIQQPNVTEFIVKNLPVSLKGDMMCQSITIAALFTACFYMAREYL